MNTSFIIGLEHFDSLTVSVEITLRFVHAGAEAKSKVNNQLTGAAAFDVL